jgi:hypothetical protein
MASGRLEPRRWTDEELEADRLAALAAFVEERGRSGSQSYRAAFARNEPVVRRLFEASRDLRDLTGVTLQGDPELIAAARYLAGPPISEDDLATLIGGKFTHRSPDTIEAAATVVRSALDPIRYPWLSEGREPVPAERETAISWTAGLWAAEQLRTLRRTEASQRQEAAVVGILQQAGFQQHARLRSVHALDELPRGTFTRETVLAGTKCDIPIRLRDGRLLALECKVSNSALNSVKRLVRETGGKARRWHDAYGEQVVTGVVLGGVFRMVNLKDAQDNYKLAIFWEHNLVALEDFVVHAR